MKTNINCENRDIFKKKMKKENTIEIQKAQSNGIPNR